MPVFKKVILALLLLICVFLGGYFLLRNSLLEKALNKVEDKFREKYGMEFSVGKAEFTGFARITLQNLVLTPSNRDTLFICREATASFSLARFIKGQPPVNNAVLSDAQILLHESDSLKSNFRALLSPSKKKSANSKVKRIGGPGTLLDQAWKRFLALADFNFMISNLEIRWRAPGYFERLMIEEFFLNETKMTCHASDSATGGVVNWTADGIINSKEDLIVFEGYHGDSVAHEIPFFRKISGISSGLTRISARIQKPDDSYMLEGTVIAPFINHWRIAPDDVRIDSASASLIIETADTSIHLIKGSSVTVNKARLDLESTVTKGITTSIELNAEMPDLSADNFFSSLPDGLFSSVKGMKADGTISYTLHVSLNTAFPDSVEFDSDLNARKFRIRKYGNENLSMMSGPFMYEARENDRVVKVFETGPSNPSFTPYADIPQLLVNCVLISEDGTFWHHRGFNEEAFRKSIATNIKQKRFARGGSTISMQLVKNVHLNRNKTISRKIEEALLVWMIENFGLCSKERMLEVYLNVIEWGPGIYGIHDAAQFYFSKKPAELTLEECIFLASIIPNPKAFRYSFNPDGTLRPRLEGYYKLVAGRLAGKELITQQQADSVGFQVNLSGPAREMVVKPDSAVTDTTIIPEETEIQIIP